MKEVNPNKGLYTNEEFDRAVADGEDRQNGITATGTVDGELAPDQGISPEESRQINTITLMRIYDVLGAILTHLDEPTATALLEVHAQGGLVGPLPALNL